MCDILSYFAWLVEIRDFVAHSIKRNNLNMDNYIINCMLVLVSNKYY